MKFIERFVLYLFPILLLKRTKWEIIWLQQEKREFLSAIRVFFGLAAIVYALHYFTVDRAEGLAPSELWFRYRFGMTAIALVCLAFYSTPRLYATKYFRIPMILACATFCYFQTRTLIWYPKVPYLYSFAFVLISAMVLRSSVLNSLLFSLGLLLLIGPSLLESGQSPAMMLSASVVTLIYIIYMKSKYLSDLNLFIANQNNFDSQKKIIEINMEFTNQIKSFLPAEISNRLVYYVQDQRMSVLQAIDEVLRPRKTQIACLFSDIRGFTKAASDLNGYVTQSLFPNIKASTAATERFSGIPRKIGDLLFAYYDDVSYEKNILNALRSAVEISNLNNEMNQQLPEDMRVKRFILMSGGEAIVGNISGYDSTIEITAIGTPVNFLSRIDELTKNPVLREKISGGDIILTPNIAKEIQAITPGISLTSLSIAAMNLKIRDFEEVEELFLLPLTKRNFQIIFKDSKSKPLLEAA